MSLIKFPAVHKFETCKDCGGGSWRICWPKNNKVDTYIECLECGAEFNIKIDLNPKPK